MTRSPTRSLALPVVLALLLALLAPLRGARAGDDAAGRGPAGSGPQPAGDKKAGEPAPVLASDADAAEALATFKKAFRARGLKGDEKLAEQAVALRAVAKVQHPKVVDALAKVARNRDADLRTAAVLRLGDQRALPGSAGQAVVDALGRHRDDPTFVMACLASISRLRYLGAPKRLAALMKDHEYAVVKAALTTIGKLKDARFIDEIVKLLKQLKLEKGAKWDGVEVHYDSGASGNSDQETAERMGHAAESKNKRKGKHAARSMRDLGPVVLEVLHDLTGERFSGGIEARKWLDANRKKVDDMIAAVEKQAAAQK